MPSVPDLIAESDLNDPKIQTAAPNCPVTSERPPAPSTATSIPNPGVARANAAISIDNPNGDADYIANYGDFVRPRPQGARKLMLDYDPLPKSGLCTRSIVANHLAMTVAASSADFMQPKVTPLGWPPHQNSHLPFRSLLFSCCWLFPRY